jgi:hypothetical protein
LSSRETAKGSSTMGVWYSPTLSTGSPNRTGSRQKRGWRGQCRQRGEPPAQLRRN